MPTIDQLDILYGTGGYGEGYYGGTVLPYYLSKLTSEYRNLPKFRALVSALLQVVDDLVQVIATFTYAFDLDQAEGAQLDILGEIIGVGRTVNFQPSNGVSPVLDDETYRILIRAKIAKNYWDGRLASLFPIWQDLFPGGTISVQDNQNMSISIFLAGSFSSIIRDLIMNDMIVPRPEGVLVNHVIGDLPFFGFDRDDDFVAGFDKGKFA